MRRSIAHSRREDAAICPFSVGANTERPGSGIDMKRDDASRDLNASCFPLSKYADIHGGGRAANTRPLPLRSITSLLR